MNNNKLFDYGKKYHYMLKYIILGLPIIIMIIECFVCYEGTELNGVLVNRRYDLSSVYDFFMYFSSFRINQWYVNLLNLLDVGFDYNGGMWYDVLTIYPLYVLWVYMFDIILDVFALVPRLAHKFLTKFGGDY